MVDKRLSDLDPITVLADTDTFYANAGGVSSKVEFSNVRIATSTANINQQTGTTYTTVLADVGRIIEMSNTSAITLTVADTGNVSYQPGATLNVVQTGSGNVTVTGGFGVTINKPAALNAVTREQYSIISMYMSSADVWILGGDLSLV